MSFQIKIQKCSAEKNRVNKSNYIRDIITVTGTLREKSSIVDPVIKIECDLASVKDANYMTIESFGRSYFIKDMQSINEGLVEFYCHVDVLHTFQDAIKNNDAIIRRQSDSWNLYLNDSEYKTYQDRSIITIPFSNGGFGSYNFVMAVAGR